LTSFRAARLKSTAPRAKLRRSRHWQERHRLRYHVGRTARHIRYQRLSQHQQRNRAQRSYPLACRPRQGHITAWLVLTARRCIRAAPAIRTPRRPGQTSRLQEVEKFTVGTVLGLRSLETVRGLCLAVRLTPLSARPLHPSTDTPLLKLEVPVRLGRRVRPGTHRRRAWRCCQSSSGALESPAGGSRHEAL